MATDEYLILRHQNVKLHQLIPHLAFRTKLSSAPFTEVNSSSAADLQEHKTDASTSLTLVAQKLLWMIAAPMSVFGWIVEFFLNLFPVNGGFFGFLWGVVTLSVVLPLDREAANFRSFIGHIDGRYDLNATGIHVDDDHPVDPLPGLKSSPINLSVTAAKLSYENAAFIRSVVNNKWRMHFVEFFDCYNKYLKSRGTQAYVFTDKPDDANLIVLAFRGTEPFNAVDWITDVDLSWLSMGKLGQVHLGFMRALGLQSEVDCFQGFPRDYTKGEDGQSLAYYAIREKLRELLEKHPGAKVMITGHSLGGALATLFPAILGLHDEREMLGRLYGVLTYGQPRVGDARFCAFMNFVLGRRYHRMVYRYDLVPRVPSDLPPVARFKHIGSCIYYNGWYEGEIVKESPNPNYLNPRFMISMHLCALHDLFTAFFFALLRVEDFVDEGPVSLLFRLCGLFLPGIAFHSLRDYHNGGKLAKIKRKLFKFANGA